MGIVERIKRFRFRSLEKRRLTSSDQTPIENTDAMSVRAGAPGLGGAEMVPPNYVNVYDEGRPRK